MVMQLHRKGHQFGSKTMKRRIERTQRQATKLFLTGKTVKKRKKKPVKTGQVPVIGKPYPCGPKQMTLGEAFR